LRKRFPLPVGGKEIRWEKAITARAFDVLRGFLPAGIATQLSWTTNLRQAHEHLLRLEAHPLDEVRKVGDECRRTLVARYPNSFGHQIGEQERAYLRLAGAGNSYTSPESIPVASGEFHAVTDIDNTQLENEALELIQKRPRKVQLPKALARFGHYKCRFTLDFGSFRDLQRHRGGLYRMPLLTSDLGFHPWYFDQLPNAVRETAASFIRSQMTELDTFAASLSKEERQYYLPNGMNVACEIIYDLPQMVYVAELRTNQTVHPTLRSIAIKFASMLAENHPKLALYADMSESEFCIRRGDQDIIERSTAA
jgi:thymidylate synthase ThyX